MADEAARAIELARACRSAAHAMALYPAAHPGIATSVARLTEIAARTTAAGPLTFTPAAGALLIAGERVATPDAGIAEFSALLHRHAVGRLTVRAGMSRNAWLQFLQLLRIDPDALRAQGGMARAWMASGEIGLDISEIDYVDLLRERDGGDADWQTAIEQSLDAPDTANGGAIDEPAPIAEQAAPAGPEPLSITNEMTVVAEAAPPEDVAELLSAYTDSRFVGQEYERELARAPRQAEELDRIQDDAPEQIAAWLATIGPRALASLDVQLLLDLLQVEQQLARWEALLDPALGRAADLAAAGEVDAAGRLVSAVAAAAAGAGAERQRAAAAAIERAITRFRAASHPAARRMAAALLGARGGRDALVELRALLADDDTAVQREVVRAVLAIGSREAFDSIKAAILGSPPAVRDRILRAIGLARQDGPAPLLTHLLGTLARRGSLADVHERALELLGTTGSAAAVPVLSRALAQGEWWAPLRTTRLRRAAAAALGRIGAPEADAVLRDAAANGSRGVRAAARTVLNG
ncbi:MAG TPA: HEAT repeat domain-containing protein [Vicinamibacterales bacterium]|jgi:hypothetical protein